MSNLSDIGFPVSSEQDVNQIIMDILPHLSQVPCPPYGFYFRFEDPSGSQIFLQTNSAQEIVGFNPSFKAESRWQLKVKSVVERDTSDLDGAFQCFSVADKGSESPILFDSPDFRTHLKVKEGTDINVGITAFASNDFEFFADQSVYEETVSGTPVKSMMATGLFETDKKGERVAKPSPQAHVLMTGVITEAYLRKNNFTEEQFYALVVDTSGGFVDVVVDPRLVEGELKPGNVIKGSFWLSGQIS